MKALVRMLLLCCLLLLAACDSAPAPEPVQPSVATATAGEPTTAPEPTTGRPTEDRVTPTGTIVDRAEPTAPATPDESAPSPTPVTATGTGEELTALEALRLLKEEAMAWQPDARLAMLANVRPGQQGKMLAGTLGDPDVNEPTPGGKGRNWTLLAISPSSGGAMAISMDGERADLVEEGAATDEVLSGFTGPGTEMLALESIEESNLVDSDEVFNRVGERAEGEQIGIALIAPDGLGLGPLPTPESGGRPASLAYQLYSTDASTQMIIFFDAATGETLLDISSP